LNYFDPKVLAKLKNLYLRAKFVVDGLMIGIHPSRSKGFSSEFEEHREYTQGDDIRHIDWKAYGKSDRFFIKEYREATNLRGHILLDCSASMSYASDGWSKFDYGATLAASLAYLMLKQQDAAGLMTFSQKIDRTVPPLAAPGHLFTILKELEAAAPRGETAAGAILQELAGSVKRRGFIVLISDLLDRAEEVLRGLKQLRSKGSDVIVFQLLDRDELEFPFEESTLFEDLEEDLKLLADPPTIRTSYRKAVLELIEGYRQSCTSYRIDYSLFDTTAGLDRALVRYLTWREKFRRS
jgi:uncharacterized protein (DUF58 family)